MPTLYLDRGRAFPGSDALLSAARGRGISTKSVRFPRLLLGWYERRRADDSLAYGWQMSVAAIASRLGLRMIGPPADWAARAPRDLVPYRTQIRECGHGYVGAMFPAVVPWKARYLAMVSHRQIRSLNLWLRGVQTPDPTVYFDSGFLGFSALLRSPLGARLDPAEEAEVRSFLEEALARDDLPLPPVLGMVVGVSTETPGFVIERIFPAFSAPFAPHDASTLLDMLPHALKPSDRLTADDKEWLLEYKPAILLRPESR